jgi:transcriptional regulator with XRE-family HTH domain
MFFKCDHDGRISQVIQKKQEVSSLVQQILEAMAVRGWKPIDLIRESGVDRATVYRILRGSINVKIDSLSKIFETLSKNPIKNTATEIKDAPYLSWETKKLIERMEKEIDRLSSDLKRLESHEDEILKAINTHSSDFTELRKILHEAGITGNIKVLERISETGK